MTLDEEQIRRGYWYYNPDKGWPPDATDLPDEYDGSSILLIAPTQLGDCTPYQQRKIWRQWCDVLPTLSNVKTIFFNSRVNQELFDAACEMPRIEAIYVKWSGIKSLAALERCSSLKHLRLGSSSQIRSIDILAEMKSLITLELENLKRISDFSVLGELTNLEGLGVEGSMWTVQRIQTLEFVGNLKNLLYLTITSSRVLDKSFDPVLKLESLVRFDTSWNYPESEFEKLKSLPNLKFGNVETSKKEALSEWNNPVETMPSPRLGPEGWSVDG